MADTKDDPRFEIKDDEMVEIMRGIGGHIHDAMPPGWGFALFIFKFRDKPFFWISDADRADMIKALKEFIARETPN
jgi:hypothetical protein